MGHQCESVIGKDLRTQVFCLLKKKKQDVYPFDSIIRIDSNSSALPVKEVRVVQRRNNNNIKNAFRLVLPYKLITKRIWYYLNTCPHSLLRKKGGFLPSFFPVWAIKNKPFLSLPRSVIMADESNVAGKRIFTESNSVILVNIDSRLCLPSPLFSAEITVNSRIPPKQGTEILLLHLEIGMQMTLSRPNIQNKQRNDRRPLCAGRKAWPLCHTYSRGLVV